MANNQVRPFPNGDQLFEFCAIYHPLQTKEQRDKGEHQKSEMIVKVQQILAKNEGAAQVLASRQIPEAFLDKLDHVEIIVRPF